MEFLVDPADLAAFLVRKKKLVWDGDEARAQEVIASEYEHRPQELFTEILDMRTSKLARDVVFEVYPPDQPPQVKQSKVDQPQAKQSKVEKIDGLFGGVLAPENRPPPVMEMAKNFAKSMGDWAKGGFGKVSAEAHEQRMVICRACEFWNPSGLAGMGQCTKCGCSGAKQWLPTSACPIGKWGAINDS